MDREGGAKAATVGPVCRGRNDVLAHGNADVWNLVHSGSQACTKLREPSGNALAAALQTNGRQRSRRKPARANGSLQALRQLNESNLWPATACIISPICMSSLFIILSGFKDARLGNRASASAALRRFVQGAAVRQTPCTACGCSGRVSAAPGAAAQLQAWRPAVSACLPLAVAVDVETAERFDGCPRSEAEIVENLVSGTETGLWPATGHRSVRRGPTPASRTRMPDVVAKRMEVQRVTRKRIAIFCTRCASSPGYDRRGVDIEPTTAVPVDWPAAALASVCAPVRWLARWKVRPNGCSGMAAEGPRIGLSRPQRAPVAAGATAGDGAPRWP
jgi:hypothetical protein